VNLNLTATFVLCRGAGRVMIGEGGGGAIVNIASVAGLVGSGSLPQAGYAASKAGCINLTRELAFQWARHGIRVNALAPGWVSTEMTAEWLATDKGREAVIRTTPLRRVATVDEIACAALFLASEASSYVTGAVLAVDGGWTAV
jgi:NAD(P)-dependent dehydrogenase (short-subunit alcohol dehydrogenase family)